MRRKEFSVTELETLEAFLAEMKYGFLASVGEDGWPHLKALNFVYHEGAIYFHGSKVGEKMKDFKHDNRVTFSVAKELSIIPSHFTTDKLACPATAFFQSVTIKGRVQVVEDLQEKAQAFTAFMQKLQPEGGYAPIDPVDEEYARNLRATGLVRIDIEDMAAKFKLGQNMKMDEYTQVVAGLQGRAKELDEETLEMMKKYCPHHQMKWGE